MTQALPKPGCFTLTDLPSQCRAFSVSAAGNGGRKRLQGASGFLSPEVAHPGSAHESLARINHDCLTCRMGFPGGASGKEPACQCKTCKRLQVQSLGQEDALEEGMGTHSSILAWGIPWMEEPGGLQSLGSHRVRHNWSMSACTYTRWSCMRAWILMHTNNVQKWHFKSVGATGWIHNSVRAISSPLRKK